MTRRFFFRRLPAVWPWLLVAMTVVAMDWAARAAQPKAAQVTAVIKDVKLLPPQAPPHPARISETIASGTGLRTGVDSRAELTFADLTITRLGANTVFSFNEGARELNLNSGAVLIQVPKSGSAVKVSTAGFTCAVTGGTALCETHKGEPSKVMILEGSGHFCATGGGCVDIPAGEMVVMTPDGRFSQPFKFNVARVMETSLLITDFPPLPNAYLITEIIDQQAAPGATPGGTPVGSGISDATSQRFATGTPPPAPAGSPNEFGPPVTITSPNPYIISNGTSIQTDPTITTNGITDLGTIYRGQAIDGVASAFVFGSTSSFDTLSGFDADIGNGSGGGMGAVFKFTALQITGDPMVSTLNGQINLGLIAVNSITSSEPGGVLTFAGIRGLLLATQNGPVTLGGELTFSSLHDIHIYARGVGSDLNIGSTVETTGNIHLYAQGNIRVDGDETTGDFSAFSGGNFTLGFGNVMATNIDIQSQGDINVNAGQLPDVPGGTISFKAAGDLNLNGVTGGTFGRSSLTAQGLAINILSSSPVTLDFSGATVSLTAGSGGLNISNVDIIYQDLTMQSAGAINLGSVTFGPSHTNASISAGTSFAASGDVDAATLSAGTTVDVGGQLFVEDTLAAGGNITVGTLLQAQTINAPNGVLTVGSGILPVVISTSLAGLQHTFNVASIVSPAGIDFSGNEFASVNGPNTRPSGLPPVFSPGGRLTINANTITFDPATGIGPTNFNGSDGGGTFNGGDGGVLIVNTTGDISATNSDITATTGVNSGPGVFAGAGGKVTLHSTGGMVTVNDTIQVSSDDSANQRLSASGGTIDLQSNLTTGTGITISSGAQLLSLLNLNALNAGGTPGSITLSTMGADIVVNGYVRADFGTLTLDQNDPAGLTPMITVDGGTVQAATFNINGSGDLSIGPNNSTAINIFGGTWNLAHDITLNAANTSFAFSFALNATAGNALNFTGGGAGAPAALTLNLTSASTFTAGTGGINAPFVDINSSGADLNFISAGGITAHSLATTGSASGTIAANGGALTVTGNLLSGTVSALTNISVGGFAIASTLSAGGTITVGGTIEATTATAGNDITAGNVRTQNISTPGVLTGTNGINPDVFSTDPINPAQGAMAPHVYNVASIISPNGIDFSGNQFSGIDGYSNGGKLTINTTTLTFDSASGIGQVNFNGADAGALDFNNMVFTNVGGDGGTFIVNATGDITVNASSSIIASTGENNFNFSPSTTSSGTGGTVQLNSTSGTVTVDSTVQVSSAEPTSTVVPFRASASGGNINISSGKATGVAINVTNSGQLLALLSNAAPGPGGTITVQATGASSQANVSGTVQADRGTIDIRHTGASGQINVSGATMLADVIKIGALGTNGTLNIGGGMISADSLLRLYAPSSNGTLNFTSSVNLSSGTAMDLAANTITIQPTVLVTIGGNGGAANIFTNNANYSGFGGTNPANGTFGGNGANPPQPLSAAPPLGPAPRIPAPTARNGRNH